MKELIKHYSGSAAYGMTGYGPKPTLAPPDDNGSGNGGGNGSGDGEGEKNGNGDGDKSGAGGDGKGGGESRLGQSGGLLGKRTGAAADDTKKEGEEEGGTEADGRPKGLAEKFWNAKDKAINVEALMKSHADAEKALGELKRSKGPGGGEVPETAEGYFKEGVKVPDDAPNFRGLEADDPGLMSWADVCKEEGIGKDLAGRLMTKMLVKMNDHATPPLDPDEEMKSLGKNGQSVVDGVFTWVEGMERSGDLSEDDIAVVEQMSMTANGIRLLAKFRNMSGQAPIPVLPGGGVRGMSLEQLDAQYREAVKTKNYAEQERLDNLRGQINPEGAS